MSYERRAEIILKDSIKSAIYIDEKARSFYAQESNPAINEEKLSEELYTNFKQNGISLEVFKYILGTENDKDCLNFLLDDRDFVLLDWKLDDNAGEDYSLALLSKIVEAQHIHFCSIYTSENDLDEVLENILAYFSSEDEEYYTTLKELLEIEEYDGDTIDIFKEISFNRFNREKIGESLKQLRDIDKDLGKNIIELTKEKNLVCSIIKASLALSDTYKSAEKLPCPTHIDVDNKIVVINNTIITILNKNENNANDLLQNFRNHLIQSVDSFNQLLGIELYNNLFRTSAITNDSIMSFPKEALLKHRAQLKNEELGHFFNSFMNEILLEKISLAMREKKSILLDEDFLDQLEAKNGDNPKDVDSKDLHRMNVFYNSLTLDKRGAILNFGDVFKIEGEEKFLLCITPLCDCLRPQPKTKSNFYFVEGTRIPLQEALKLGDTAFISYLQNEVTIKWTNKNNSEYGPLYIKPWQYKVFENENTINEHNQIEVHYLNRERELKTKKLNYIGTIRSNYTQRIANHAFAYPVRIGVDFVKV